MAQVIATYQNATGTRHRQYPCEFRTMPWAITTEDHERMYLHGAVDEQGEPVSLLGAFFGGSEARLDIPSGAGLGASGSSRVAA